MQREAELVVALCRTPLGDSARQRIAKLIAASINWPLFFAKVAAWGVEPLVLFNLNNNFAAELSADVRRRSARIEKNARGAALANTLVLVEVVERFRSRRIEALVLKGPAVGVGAYGDPSLRAFSDMDLLVKPQDISAARDLVRSLGYRPDFESRSEAALLRAGHALEFSGQRMKVELHTVLVSRHLRFRIDDEPLWASAREIDCAGRQLRTLGAAEHFLFLCAHGAKHEWERLSWVSDIAHLGRRLSAHERRQSAALARAAHGKRILALAVRLARDIYGEADTPFDDVITEPESVIAPLVSAAKRRIGLEAPSARAGDWLERVHPNLRPLLYWSRARERRVDQVGSLAHLLLQRAGRSFTSSRIHGEAQ
jgi:hypothetical protein